MTKQWSGKLHGMALVAAMAIAVFGIPVVQAQYTDLHDFNTPGLTAPQYPGILAEGRGSAYTPRGPVSPPARRTNPRKSECDGSYLVFPAPVRTCTARG